MTIQTREADTLQYQPPRSDTLLAADSVGVGTQPEEEAPSGAKEGLQMLQIVQESVIV